MKRRIFLSFLFSITLLFAQSQRVMPDRIPAQGGDISIQPIMHASLIVSYHNKHIYVDPAGGASLFAGLPAPDMILITDIHGDHLDSATLVSFNASHAIFVVPQAVADKLPASIDKQKRWY